MAELRESVGASLGHRWRINSGTEGNGYMQMNDAEWQALLKKLPWRKRDKIYVLPAVIMLLLILFRWVFYYSGTMDLLLFVGHILFAGISVCCACFYIIVLKPKKSFSFLLPVLVLYWLNFYGAVPAIKAYLNSRHYAEFMIQKTFFHPDMGRIKEIGEYKKWELYKHSPTDYSIVYDVSGNVMSQKGKDEYGCWSNPYKISGHFYMVETKCM